VVTEDETNEGAVLVIVGLDDISSVLPQMFDVLSSFESHDIF